MNEARRHGLLSAATWAALAASGSVGLAACGFQLRKPLVMPFSSMAFAGFAPRSPLAEELKRSLGQSVRVMESAAGAEVVLHALADVRERSVVASTSAGQVRELELRMRARLSAKTPAGRELVPPFELLLTRDLSYSENLALAKEQEEAALYREMQSDVVFQVMRRLAAIKL